MWSIIGIFISKHNYHSIFTQSQASILDFSSKKQYSIFDEFLKSIFMVLYDILLKSIDDEFFKFDCSDM